VLPIRIVASGRRERSRPGWKSREGADEPFTGFLPICPDSASLMDFDF